MSRIRLGPWEVVAASILDDLVSCLFMNIDGAFFLGKLATERSFYSPQLLSMVHVILLDVKTS